MTVGFVGLGAMGSRLARALIDAGYDLVVFDVSADALASVSAHGAAACGSPAEVADRAETVLASLPSPDVLRTVVAGENGLTRGRALKTFVDLSTTGATAIELARTLAAAGVAYLDAPVSGGVAGADARSLTVMASGSRETLEAVGPLLRTFSERIVHVGTEPGQGQTAKLLNNLLSATAMAITSEAMTLGVRAGLDPEALLEAFNGSSGRNTATASKFPTHVLTRRFAAGFRLELMLKDLRLCLDEARRLGVPLVLGGGVEQLWALGAGVCDDDADHTEIVQLFEGWTGVTVQARDEVGARRG